MTGSRPRRSFGRSTAGVPSSGAASRTQRLAGAGGDLRGRSSFHARKIGGTFARRASGSRLTLPPTTRASPTSSRAFAPIRPRRARWLPGAAAEGGDLLESYQVLERQIGLGKVKMFARHEMLELIVVDGVAKGIVARDMVTGESLESVPFGTRSLWKHHALLLYRRPSLVAPLLALSSGWFHPASGRGRPSARP